MRRGVLVSALLGIVLQGMLNVALAASQVSVEAAPDGTLVVVGSGWRPDQELVVALGGDRFPVRTDSSGGFEVATGLISYQGALAVRHPGSPEPAFAPLEGLEPSPSPPPPHPLALLFAESLLQGAALLGLTALGLGGVSFAARRLHPKRR